MQLSEIVDLLHCTCSRDLLISGISIDSRSIVPGDLFVAISGDAFDGHDFVDDAVTRGAVAVLCSQSTLNLSVPELLVDDTIEALATIATHHRQKLAAQVIALTGSNGKTTVKEMIAQILPQPAYATPGNLNNHIGVPLSLLKMTNAHQYAVFELGANHVGEIAHTVAMVKPQVALINNIAPAHIAEFGSIENVAKTKGEIYLGLTKTGIAIVNEDDAYAHFWDDILVDMRVLRFSTKKTADVYAQDITFNTEGHAQFTLVTPVGRAQIQLQVAGGHNVSNAVAAAACAHAVNISLEEIIAGLCRFSGVSGRLHFCIGKQQAVIIDDTYNANLRSSLAAVDVLSARAGRRILVLGDMGELGDYSQRHHEEIGKVARERGIERVMTCGDASEYTARAFGALGQHYANQALLLHDLVADLDSTTTVLVKGSRASKMEQVVAELL